jgi:hypothetical protein
MKNSKKIIAGLCMLFAVTATFFAFTGKVLAGVAPGDIKGGTYTFQDGANIIGDFGPSGNVAFTDNDEFDGSPNYEPDTSAFCDPGDMPDQNGISGKIKFGINLTGDKSLPNVPAQIKLGYYTGANVCNGVLLSKNIANPNQAAKTDFQWDGDTIISLNGSSNDATFTPAPNQSNEVLYLNSASGGCAESAILLDQPQGNVGRYYQFSPIDQNNAFGQPSKNLDGYPAIKGFFDRETCHVDSVGTVNISGKAGTAAPTTTTCKPTDKSCTPSKSCEANFNTAFEWLLCPGLRMADSLAGAFNDFIEGQLNFCTGKSSTTGQTCTDNNLTDPVHRAWAIFRTLASVILVIVLLVMVISQAAGWGGLDAYTVRKMLPRLIIAVFLIQISWVMFKWFIDLSNDLGQGIQDLLFAPFGGSNSISLDKLMGAQIQTTTGSHAGSDVFAFFTVIAAAGVAWVSLPAIFSLAVIVIFALLTAFVTLVFRKILIITLVLLSPVALVAWIVPGTDKYWKMWLTNFQRILLMFPMIMALIAGGRILAFVTSSSGGGAVSNFAQLAIIVVAFFGPYFFLPKAYSWGGEFMKMAGDRIKGFSDKAAEKPKQYAKDRGESWREERRRKSKERVAQGNANALDKFRSGEFDPLYGRKSITVGGRTFGRDSRRREEAVRNYRAAGVESEEKEVKAADQAFGQLASQAENHDDFARSVAGARIGSQINFRDREGNDHRLRVSAAMKRAGMNGIVKYGTDRSFRELGRVMDELNHGSKEEQILAERFRDANAPNLLSRMNYLYRGTTGGRGPTDELPVWDGRALTGPVISRTQALGPGAFAQMEAPDLEALLAGLSQTANHNESPEAQAEARQYLGTIRANYEQAINNDQIRPNIGSSVNTAMKAFLDGTNIENLNDNRELARLNTRVEQVSGVSDPTLAARIAPDGVVTSAAATSAPPSEEGPPTGGARAPGFNTGAAGNVFYSRPQSGGFGPAAAGPTVVNIDHNAISSAVAEGVARGLSSGAIDLRGNPNEEIREATTPGGVVLPQGSEESRRIEQERLNVEREQLREQRENASRNEDNQNQPGDGQG